MKATVVRRDLPVSPELEDSAFHPTLKRIYANRQIISPSDMDYGLDQLLDYHSFKDIEKAAENIADAIFKNKLIVIIGDYDADGATSTALIVKSLKAFGHEQVQYIIPSRFDFGYGLSPEIVDIAAQLKPDLIVTVDNGISSIEGVKRANEHGIRVVVTDHHIAGNVLPDAAAIVNPNQKECEFPSKCIAGVGVAFYTMLALRAYLKDQNWFKTTAEIPNMAILLDLVALGTVADVVSLDHNNRILVEQGLQRIRRGLCSHGITELLQVTDKNRSICTSTDLAFYVAPRLNAAGRLEDMSQGIECLLSDDINTARNIASQLHVLNTKRRNIEQGMLDDAYATLKLDQYNTDNKLSVALCLYDKNWHQGVIGLLASRVKERLYRPVIAFADGIDNEIKGSARSIPGLHIRDVLDEVSTKNPGLIHKFGGHAMAAGLSIKKDDFETFSKQFLKVIENKITKDDLEKTTFSDGSVPANELNIELAEILQLSGPWGQGFPEPMFDDVFEIVNWKILGGKHIKFELKCKDSDVIIDAIAFNRSDTDLPNNSSQIHISYRLSVNEFRGSRTAQLIIDTIDSV